MQANKPRQLGPEVSQCGDETPIQIFCHLRKYFSGMVVHCGNSSPPQSSRSPETHTHPHFLGAQSWEDRSIQDNNVPLVHPISNFTGILDAIVCLNCFAGLFYKVRVLSSPNFVPGFNLTQP